MTTPSLSNRLVYLILLRPSVKLPVSALITNATIQEDIILKVSQNLNGSGIQHLTSNKGLKYVYFYIEVKETVEEGDYLFEGGTFAYFNNPDYEIFSFDKDNAPVILLQRTDFLGYLPYYNLVVQ